MTYPDCFAVCYLNVDSLENMCIDFIDYATRRVISLISPCYFLFGVDQEGNFSYLPMLISATWRG